MAVDVQEAARHQVRRDHAIEEGWRWHRRETPVSAHVGVCGATGTRVWLTEGRRPSEVSFAIYRGHYCEATESSWESIENGHVDAGHKNGALLRANEAVVP